MKAGSGYLRYRPVHAPREDGAALVEPPFQEVSRLVAENLHRRTQHDFDFQGRALSDLARQGRRELIAEAQGWTSTYRDVVPRPLDPAGLVFLAGHQPQLFHPGVWFKNFALGALAARHRAVAINLIVDSDTIKESAIRVPGGTLVDPRAQAVPLDAPGPALPWEERRILDRATLTDFGRRAAAQIASLVPDPLLTTFWPLVVERSRTSDNLGACLAQARHQWEARWGLDTLEVPQSRVCRSESFGWFACHLLAHLPRLRDAYNEVVDEYRQVHRIRSTAHPVPNLAADGAWIEAPFWIWTTDDPQRRRLFARQRHGELLLSDGRQLEVGLPLEPEGQLGRAVEQYLTLAGRGIKIRSRALVTTLWARLVLGDLFLHGIGGAKYDQVTDALVTRFFGLDPPGFLILSATLLLPVAGRRSTVEELRQMQQRLRELTYHPERFLDGQSSRLGAAPGAEPADLAAAKCDWLRTPQTLANARARCRAIRGINEALQPWVAQEREELLRQIGSVSDAVRGEAVLSSREYSFCLYPERTLHEFLFALLPKSP